MKDSAPQTIYLADYTMPAYLIDTVHLTVMLDPNKTRVISRIAFRPNPETTDRTFILDGADLTLISAKIDGEPIAPTLTAEGLSYPAPDAPFIWEAEVEISPSTNTALEGLYMSGGMYCTQCEAEGFRKITYYPDRPDVMAVFTVRIEGDYPVLLSNGNPQASGDGWTEWHDPWPKPAYLFALVAGDLVAHSGSFTTMSGNDVALNIYVRPGPDESKCAFGMGALIRAMKWDEDVYGREYDLDIFNIVAVDDFNMGAMENKGLNIFNSSCVLASPTTSTDADFERIEAIIAHEYFHNWTGNRITCRDWFQLCLKEGLTVYRDQQFTSDMRSAAVKRIDDAIDLRGHQFQEDAGPLAHPPRPSSFVEINNFYTSTVYEKGAEIVGMLKTLVGDKSYYAACDLYFTRHDGQACTIEDWLACFEDTTGRDLSQFKLWYTQAGTPTVEIKTEITGRAGEVKKPDGTTLPPISYQITARQSTPGHGGQKPRLIPIKMALYDQKGNHLPQGADDLVFELDQTEMVIAKGSFLASDQPPIVSVFQNFCAPVHVKQDLSFTDRAVLLAHDTDPFNRWDAGRTLAKDLLCRMTNDGATPDIAYLDSVLTALRNDTLDAAYRACLQSLPTEANIAQDLHALGHTPDPDAIHLARQTLRQALAEHLQDHLASLYAAMQVPGPYDPDATSVGKRDLGNAILGLLTRLDGGKQATAQFANADNMTQQITALAALLRNGHGAAQRAAFAEQWQEDRLVMDKWFGLQVAASAPLDTVSTVKALTQHSAFNHKNPNRFWAVFGNLSGNPAGFHQADGSGYDLLADWLIRLDPINPQTTARMVAAFDSFRRYDVGRQDKMKAALKRISAMPNLSRDTTEMVSRILGDT